MPLQMALNNGHLETASLLQRYMGKKLREEAQQLKEERVRFWQRFANDTNLRNWTKKVKKGFVSSYLCTFEGVKSVGLNLISHKISVLCMG